MSELASDGAPVEAVTTASARDYALPDEPLVTLRPSSNWVALDLADLWRYRELLFFLTWRDVKVRYKQTLLGASWAIIQPLFTMIVFTLFFGKLADMPSDDVPYPIFAYAGLLPWTFFANAVSNSGNSLVGNANLITKVYFPRMIVPVAAVAAGLVDFAVAFVLLAILMAYYRIAPGWGLLALPALVLLVSVLATGVGMWTSALNVKYRDVRYALPFFVQLGVFVTPIIYPASIVPERWRWLLALNPMTGVVEGFRAALLGRPVVWGTVAISAAISAAILVYSAYAFRKMEKSFADIV